MSLDYQKYFKRVNCIFIFYAFSKSNTFVKLHRSSRSLNIYYKVKNYTNIFISFLEITVQRTSMLYHYFPLSKVILTLNFNPIFHSFPILVLLKKGHRFALQRSNNTHSRFCSAQSTNLKNSNISTGVVFCFSFFFYDFAVKYILQNAYICKCNLLFQEIDMASFTKRKKEIFDGPWLF